VGQIVVLVLIILTVILGIHTYLYRRLVRNTTDPGRRRSAGLWVVIGLAILVPVTLFGTQVLPRRASEALAWVGYIWLAVMFYLLVYLVLTEVVRLGAWISPWPRPAADARLAADDPPDTPAGTEPDAPPDPESNPGVDPPPAVVNPGRRLLLARTLAIASGFAAAGTVGSGVFEALGRPRLVRVPIALAKLPRRLDGTRIAVVSDIHLGPLAGRSHTQRIVDIINALDADIVAVVGDLVDGTVAELGSAAEPLRQLRSRLGNFFVTGNHEYFSGFKPWLDEVASLGIRPLRNERLNLDGIELAGVNDRTGGEYHDAPDYDRALVGRDPALPCILLAHQPVQAHEAAKRGVDLQLSGHTHGGQMVPFNYAVRLDQPIVSGLGTVGGTQVYVTKGAGFWGPPVRVGAPPEVSLVELRATG
jgi:predicted MPP superfamily phosphohydrolase